MSWKKRLRAVMVCFVLEVGALTGVPMRPDEDLRQLFEAMNEPQLAHVLRQEEDEGDDPGP